MQLKAIYVSKGVGLIQVGDSRRKVLVTPLYSIEKTVLGQDQPGPTLAGAQQQPVSLCP